MKGILLKIHKVLTVLRLRARYYRKPIDLEAIPNKLEIDIEQSLDLGSGPSPKNPFNAPVVWGVDIRSYEINESVKKCRIGRDPFPFPSDYFDAVTAYDILEHIPRTSDGEDETSFPFVFAMDEVWRVLKKGGIFYSITPCYPMKEAFQDPTHVNIMTEDTLKLYFANNSWARIYGFRGSFGMVMEGWKGAHYFCVLQKTSDEPVYEINLPQRG